MQLLWCLRRGLRLKDGPEVQEGPLSVLGWGGDSSSRHRPGQVLADLTPWAKVVQTVVCSTFTHGAKPATQKVADGERMNPQGGLAHSRQYHGDDEHQGGEHLENGPHGGLRPHTPCVWTRRPRCFTP